MKTSIRLGLLGLGTVGTGVATVLARNLDEIKRRVGCDIIITHALVKDRNKTREGPISAISLTTDPMEIIQNPDIDIVVELLGGTDIAYDYALATILQGKPLVTANKALIALRGNELFANAEQHKVMVAFEAAVAGGIPIIKALREGLAANHISEVAGIINGTCNYILTCMHNQDVEFDDVLTDAQALGYAEADPSTDVDGIDAAHKLTILSAIAFGTSLAYDQVFIEGIRHVTQLDVGYAKALGYTIKHMSIAEHCQAGITLRVHPVLLPSDCVLANVSGVNNAVQVESDALGSTLYYGKGAGGEPTASAVISDIIDVIRHLNSTAESLIPNLAFKSNALQEYPVHPIEDVKMAYYLRLTVIDKPGMLAQICHILGDLTISIEIISQKRALDDSGNVPIILITHPVQEKKMNQAITKIEALAGIRAQVVRLRIESL